MEIRENKVLVSKKSRTQILTSVCSKNQHLSLLRYLEKFFYLFFHLQRKGNMMRLKIHLNNINFY